ncbi:recombinase family protein [Pseudophaeobacter leonis]|uniref:recombinase family protein n=1 Tax=Pseudophaeobacter leonis TaxID=1144477 RepID=UPI0009F174DA|nr:recombinase family protein [Pseudophaeobacter leonis]
MKIGYKRVSTLDQNLDRQDLGEVDKLFEEKISGKSSADRPSLNSLIEFSRQGDEVLVHSIDRLARDLRDLQEIVQVLNDKKVSVKFLSENLTFSSDQYDALANLQLQMMGAFAEFERNMIRKRQAEGIAKAKQRGVYKGRKASIDPTIIQKLAAQGKGATNIATELGVSRASVYRLLKNQEMGS